MAYLGSWWRTPQHTVSESVCLLPFLNIACRKVALECCVPDDTIKTAPGQSHDDDDCMTSRLIAPRIRMYYKYMYYRSLVSNCLSHSPNGIIHQLFTSSFHSVTFPVRVLHVFVSHFRKSCQKPILFVYHKVNSTSGCQELCTCLLRRPIEE